MLVFLAGDVFQYFLHPAVENAAKVIECGGVDGLIFAELVDGGAGDAMSGNQRICGFPGGFQ